MEVGSEEEETSLLRETECADNFEDVLEKIGYGWFHHKLLIILAWAVASDAVEIVCVSFILPSVECDLDLNSFQKGWLNAVIFLGMMVGGFVWGPLSDIHGRRRILICCLLVNGLAGLGSSFAQSYPFFLALRIVSGIGVGGSYPVVFSYIVEFQGRSYRGRVVSVVCSLWMFAGMATAGLAWGIIPLRQLGIHTKYFTYNSWRIFLTICTIPSLTAAFFVFLLPESPKYLLRANLHEKAVNILNVIARNNGVINSDEKLVKNVYLGVVQEDPISPGFCGTLISLKQTIATLFSRRWRFISLLLLVVNFTLAFGYYGILLWLPQLFVRVELNGGTICAPSNHIYNTSVVDMCTDEILSRTEPYWEGFLVNLCNLPGNILSILLVDKVGRKPLLSTSMLLTGVCVFFTTIASTKRDILIITCVFGGMSAIGWNSLGVLGSEALPTSLRATCMGLAQGLSRVGSTLGNLAFGAMVDVHCVVPLFMSAGMLAFGAFATLFFPNTTGTNIQ